MPTDMAKNEPATVRNLFKRVSVNDSPDTYTEETVNGVVVTPYIYSASTIVDPVARGNHGFLEHNGSLYVFGGHTISLARYLGPSPPPDYANDMWKYDLVSNSWSNIITTNTPTARQGAAFFKYSSLAYLLFGYGNVGGVPTHLDSFHSYSFSTQTWTLVTTLADPADGKPDPRQLFGYSVYQGELYIFGGLTNTALFDVGDAWKLNLTTFQWTKLTDNMNYAKHSFDVSVIGGTAYLFGGESNFTPIESALSYTFATDTLNELGGEAPTFIYTLPPAFIRILIQNFPTFAALVNKRLGPAKLYRSFVLGKGTYANEAQTMFALGGFTPAFIYQAKVKLVQYNAVGNTWTNLTNTTLPYTKADMNSLAGFGCYSSGLAVNYQAGQQATQTSFDYEVFVDDGYSGDVEANYHTGLWKITVRYDTGTWSFVNSVRMPGKGLFLANTSGSFVVNNIAVSLAAIVGGSALNYTTNNASKNTSFETLIIRP